MGNKEALLEAAKRCLAEKGFAQTSARDIASSAGVSLAAIGYHYGTKDKLLTAALMEGLMTWTRDLEALMKAEGDEGSPAERFERTWRRVVQSFIANRSIWQVQFEIVGGGERYPELRAFFAEANARAWLGLVELFGPTEEANADPAARLRLGAYYQVLFSGIAAQTLTDADTAVTGKELIEITRALARRLSV